MTRDEQIKQNAEEYAIQFLEPYDEEYAPIKYVTAQMAHIAGAHSRDEEITILENQLKSAISAYDRISDESKRISIKNAQIENELSDYKSAFQVLETEIKRLRNPWISIKERLPEKAIGLYELEEDERHKMVLFKTANGNLYRGYLDAEEIWRAFTVPYKGAYPIDSLTWSEVTHWMPIPKV